MWETGRLAVSFDLEGAEALDGDAAIVEVFHRLGVRAMLIAYNHANRAGGGCHDDPQQGLTAFGREVVREMNRVGMLVDATHCSHRTTMDLFEVSEGPVIFSHSAPKGVAQHDRNVDDEQMRACAACQGEGIYSHQPSTD
jgi:membrane dipeptidase